MKRSTGGLVLLERTSVKDGSLFLRLLAQSSICRFSSSIASRLLVAGKEEEGSSSVVNKGVGSKFTGKYYVTNHPVFPHHDIYKGALSCSTRNPYLVLTDWATVSRNEVILIFRQKVTQTR